MHTLAIRLGATFDESHGVLGELASGLDDCLELVHCGVVEKPLENCQIREIQVEQTSQMRPAEK